MGVGKLPIVLLFFIRSAFAFVNHNGQMDYKRNGQRPWWALGCNKFYFRGKIITFEEYGNLNYGYVGKALGVSDWIIFAGGGFAAFTGKDAKSWRVDYFFDSEDDHDSISWGIDIYKAFIRRCGTAIKRLNTEGL